MAEPDPQIEAVKIAGEWNKQLGLWATGAVVLSISFMKDLLQGVDLSTFWRFELVVSWILLLASIVIGILAYGAPITGSGLPSFQLAVNTSTRSLSKVQAGLFVAGIAALVAFGGFNLPAHLSTEKPPKQNDSPAAIHFRIFKSAEVRGSTGQFHAHTFLVDEFSGETWEMICAGNTVRFRRVDVEGLAIKSAAVPK